MTVVSLSCMSWTAGLSLYRYSLNRYSSELRERSKALAQRAKLSDMLLERSEYCRVSFLTKLSSSLRGSWGSRFVLADSRKKLHKRGCLDSENFKFRLYSFYSILLYGKLLSTPIGAANDASMIAPYGNLCNSKGAEGTIGSFRG